MPARAPKTHSAAAPVGAGTHTPSVRDAALRRLSRARRWLLAGTVTLTGVLAAVAASALPGKSVKSAPSAPGSREAAASATANARSREGSSAGEASTLQAPTQEPQASAPTEGTASSGASPEAPVVSGGS